MTVRNRICCKPNRQSKYRQVDFFAHIYYIIYILYKQSTSYKWYAHLYTSKILIFIIVIIFFLPAVPPSTRYYNVIRRVFVPHLTFVRQTGGRRSRPRRDSGREPPSVCRDLYTRFRRARHVRRRPQVFYTIYIIASYVVLVVHLR